MKLSLPNLLFLLVVPGGRRETNRETTHAFSSVSVPRDEELPPHSNPESQCIHVPRVQADRICREHGNTKKKFFLKDSSGTRRN